MLKNKILVLLLMIGCAQIDAQTPFPLTFTWKGMINNSIEYEMLVKMVDTDAALNGKKSRLSGYCTFPKTWQQLRVEGISENGKITLNLFEEDKMVQSFLFDKTDRREKRQQGNWTDGKEKYPVWLETDNPTTLPKSMLIGFCQAVNNRIGRLQADTVAAPILQKIAIAPFQEIGEGYRLETEAFLEADYYGATFLSFADSTIAVDSTLEIRQISWQLLPSTEARPFILEKRSLYKDQNLTKLQLAVWQYRGNSWIPTDATVFPEAFIKDKMLQLPTDIVDLIITSKKLVFFVANTDKPIVLEWTGLRFE